MPPPEEENWDAFAARWLKHRERDAKRQQEREEAEQRAREEQIRADERERLLQERRDAGDDAPREGDGPPRDNQNLPRRDAPREENQARVDDEEDNEEDDNQEDDPPVEQPTAAPIIAPAQVAWVITNTYILAPHTIVETIPIFTLESLQPIITLLYVVIPCILAFVFSSQISMLINFLTITTTVSANITNACPLPTSSPLPILPQANALAILLKQAAFEVHRDAAVGGDVKPAVFDSLAESVATISANETAWATALKGELTEADAMYRNLQGQPITRLKNLNAVQAWWLNTSPAQTANASISSIHTLLKHTWLNRQAAASAITANTTTTIRALQAATCKLGRTRPGSKRDALGLLDLEVVRREAAQGVLWLLCRAGRRAVSSVNARSVAIMGECENLKVLNKRVKGVGKMVGGLNWTVAVEAELGDVLARFSGFVVDKYFAEE